MCCFPSRPYLSRILCPSPDVSEQSYQNLSLILRVCASGMSALVLVQICAGMGAQAVLPADIVRWEYLRLLSAACIPGTWLLFSVHFARANARDMMAQWRWVILASFVLPLVLVIA